MAPLSVVAQPDFSIRTCAASAVPFRCDDAQSKKRARIQGPRLFSFAARTLEGPTRIASSIPPTPEFPSGLANSSGELGPQPQWTTSKMGASGAQSAKITRP